MKHGILFILLMVSFVACKEKYDIKVSTVSQPSLVVDGNLNINGTTTIHLSRTVPIQDTIKSNAETAAVINVEGKDNSLADLFETLPGTYSGNINIIIGNEYRLRIKTKDGKVYLSDYVLAKQNPPIDSIGWDRTKDGVTIYANTHDPQNNTWYYRWYYEETYEYHSHFASGWKYVETTNQVVPRLPSENVYVCWRTNISNEILLGSSAKLNSDIISEFPLMFIPNNSEKVSIRYSIYVKQYSLSKEAFNYLQIMKKNTESIGSIFGVLPTEMNGNIHCISNPAEQVIGYLTASVERELRIFIDNSQLPGWNYLMPCLELSIPNNPDSLRLAFPALIPIDAIYGSTPKPIAFSASDPDCVDCTHKGGTTTKPSFW
jgi:hypothetical protein